MFKIAGIFPKYLADSFATAGMLIRPAGSSTEALKALNDLDQQKFNLVFLTEDLAHGIKQEVEDLNKKNYLSVILLPSYGEKTSIAKERLADLSRRAVGITLE